MVVLAGHGPGAHLLFRRSWLCSPGVAPSLVTAWQTSARGASSQCSTALRQKSGRESSANSTTLPSLHRKASTFHLFRPLEAVKLQRNVGKRKSAVVSASAVGPASASIVSASSGRALWAILAVCAALGQVLEARTRWGAAISAPLLAMGLAMFLSAARVIPAGAPAYEIVWGTVMPLALCLSLLETDVRRVFSDAGSTLTAFLLGAIATVIGTFVSFAAFGKLLGPTGWKMAACLCSTYVGGSINFAATAQAVGLASGSTLAAAMAADNVAMAAYLAVLMGWPVDKQETDAAGSQQSTEQPASPTVESMAVSLAAAAVACVGGKAVAARLPPACSGLSLALTAIFASGISALAAAFAKAEPGQTRVALFAGADVLGGAFMLIFFTVVGATANLSEALVGGWPLLAFILLLLAVHVLLIYGLGRLFRLPIRSILVASNANVGGPATAAAMATARGWPSMVRPALLTGTLGYTIGTAIGCLVGRCLQ